MRQSDLTREIVRKGCAGPSAEIEANTELYPQFDAPLRNHLCFLDGALSVYGGGPAGQDVARAWLAVIAALSASHAIRSGR